MYIGQRTVKLFLVKDLLVNDGQRHYLISDVEIAAPAEEGLKGQGKRRRRRRRLKQITLLSELCPIISPEFVSAQESQDK